MSREMGYYELKLMMLKETRRLKEATQLDVEHALEDLRHANLSPGMILDGLQNDIYGDGPLRAQLSLFRQDHAGEGATEGAILWAWVEHRMKVAGEGEIEEDLSDLLRLNVGRQKKASTPESMKMGEKGLSTSEFTKMGESATKGLPKLRGRKYRRVTGSELGNMIAEDCAAAKKLGRFDDLEKTNIAPDEAFQAGHAVAHEEDAPPADLPQGIITKVEDVAPDHDGDGMGPDDGGRSLGNGGKSRMSRQQLHKIAEYSVELWNLLGDEDEIPEWCQSKIAVMADAIGKVKHHLEYKIEKPLNLSLAGDGSNE